MTRRRPNTTTPVVDDMVINEATADVVCRDKEDRIIGFLHSFQAGTGPEAWHGLDYWKAYRLAVVPVPKIAHTMDVAKQQLLRDIAYEEEESHKRAVEWAAFAHEMKGNRQ